MRDTVLWARKKTKRVMLVSRHMLSTAEIVRQKQMFNMPITPEDAHGPFPRFVELPVRPTRFVSHGTLVRI